MLIDTSTLKPTDERSASDQLQIYNALDCCLTFEIHDSLKRLTNAEPIAYSFARAMQAPALEMMLRGFKVDGLARRQGQQIAGVRRRGAGRHGNAASRLQDQRTADARRLRRPDAARRWRRVGT